MRWSLVLLGDGSNLTGITCITRKVFPSFTTAPRRAAAIASATAFAFASETTKAAAAAAATITKRGRRTITTTTKTTTTTTTTGRATGSPYDRSAAESFPRRNVIQTAGIGTPFSASRTFSSSSSSSSWGGASKRVGMTTTTDASRKSDETRGSYAFPPYNPIPCVPVAGTTTTATTTSRMFPVHRIYCVGRNYADHAVEMGGDPDREPPFFFTKPPDAVVPLTPYNSGYENPIRAEIPYPTATENLHHEIELVVAIGKSGRDIDPSDAHGYVYGYAVGIDLTRRDVQKRAKEKGLPWDASKGFDNSAPVSHIYPVRASPATERHDRDDDIDDVTNLSSIQRLHESLTGKQNDDNDNDGDRREHRIWLSVNGIRKQDGALKQMIWSVPETISILSGQFHLRPGDLIFTGTPSGVGPLNIGGVVTAGIDGFGRRPDDDGSGDVVSFTLVARE